MTDTSPSGGRSSGIAWGWITALLALSVIGLAIAAQFLVHPAPPPATIGEDLPIVQPVEEPNSAEEDALDALLDENLAPDESADDSPAMDEEAGNGGAANTIVAPPGNPGRGRRIEDALADLIDGDDLLDTPVEQLPRANAGAAPQPAGSATQRPQPRPQER